MAELLRAIRQQNYKDYEILIIDSGSSDRTLEIARELADSVLQIENRDFTFGYSLNMGCKNAKGKYLVFISGHTTPVDNNWLGTLIAPFEDEKVAMVYGRQIGNRDTKFSEKRDFEKLFGRASFKLEDSLFYANNANSAIKKDLWEKHPFDEYLFGLEDIEWTKHVFQEGMLVKYEPKASVYHIHQEKWAQVFNRYRREAIAAARIGLRRPINVRTNPLWLLLNIFQDVFASVPNFSLKRLEEIGRFRYYQWKGTRQGWFHDKEIDLNRDKYSLFYPATNKAVVIRGKNRAELEDVSLPEARPGDILIGVNYVGVCRTDLEVLDGSLGYYRDGAASYPIIPGHEFSGTIVRVGANNRYRERFKVGEKVVGECILSKGINSPRQEVGVINYNGAYAQFIIMPGQNIHHIPEGLDLKIACLAEPLAVVLRAIRRAEHRLSPETKIAIIGAGSIGNFCAQVLAMNGHKVTVFDKNKERLGFLRGTAETSSSLESLQGFDLIIEATGSAEVLTKVLKESKVNSTLLLIGFPYGQMSYNFENIVGQEKVIIGSVGGDPQDFNAALKILPKLDTKPFVQSIRSLEKFTEAWKMQKSNNPPLKIILKIQKHE